MTDDEFGEVPAGKWRLYKAAARVPTWGGVPSMAIAVSGAVIMIAAVQISLWAYLAAIPTWIILAAVTKTDDRALRQWWLWMRYTAWPALHHWRSYRLWGAVSFAPIDYRPADKMVATDALPFVLPFLVVGGFLQSWLLAALALPGWLVAVMVHRRRTA